MKSRVRIIGPYKIIKIINDDDIKLISKNKHDKLTLVEGVIPIGYFPSVNNMYGTNKYGSKFLLPEWVDIRNKATQWLSVVYKGNEVPENIKLSITLGFMMRWDVHRKDLDNMQKFVIDTLANFFNFNDNRIFDSRAFKAQITNEGYKSDLLFFRIELNPKTDEQIYIDLNKLEIN